MEIVLLVTGLLAFATAGWLHYAGWLSRRVKRRVIVHTDDERSYAGLLVATRSDGIALAHVQMVESGTELAGEVFLPRSTVRFVQVVSGQ